MHWLKSSVLRVRNLTLLLGLMAIPVATPVAAGDLAYVTCQNGDALSVLNLPDPTQNTQWSLPGKPAGIAVDRTGIYTVSADSKTVRRLDPVTGETLAETILDGGPIGVALDAARGRLFVSDWYNARVWVLAADTLAKIQTLPVGAAPAGLALSDDGQRLAIANKDADQVSIFDAQTLQLRATAPVGHRPFGLRFAPSGQLFVGNVGSNDVTVLGKDGDTLATIPVGNRPYGVAFAQNRAFVTNQYENTVSVIDLATLTVIKVIDTGEYPEGIDNTADQNRILVANWFDNTMTIIDAQTLFVLEDVETCDGPRAFGEFILRGPP